jgi:hypothetical protein
MNGSPGNVTKARSEPTRNTPQAQFLRLRLLF